MFSAVIKVLGLSVLLSVAIKYGGPLLAVTGTAFNAWVAVLVPPSVMAIALAWRAYQDAAKPPTPQSNAANLPP